MTLAYDLKGVMHDETLICLKRYSHQTILSMLTYRYLKLTSHFGYKRNSKQFTMNNIARLVNYECATIKSCNDFFSASLPIYRFTK